jgi:hypothetical protein
MAEIGREAVMPDVTCESLLRVMGVSSAKGE